MAKAIYFEVYIKCWPFNCIFSSHLHIQCIRNTSLFEPRYSII